MAMKKSMKKAAKANDDTINIVVDRITVYLFLAEGYIIILYIIYKNTDTSPMFAKITSIFPHIFFAKIKFVLLWCIIDTAAIAKLRIANFVYPAMRAVIPANI